MNEYNGFLKLLEKECIKGRRIIPIPHDYAMCILAEVKELQENNEYLKRLCETQNNREYRSKFLKEFQKEHGKNVYPDYDEIYKRYDSLKEENKQLENNRDKAIEILYKRKHVENLFGGVENSNTDKIINILKGDSDE